MFALYTAKCFWPGVTERELRLAADRAEGGRRDSPAIFRGALHLPGDGLVPSRSGDGASRPTIDRCLIEC